MNYKELTQEQKDAMPDTYGIPVNDPHALRVAASLWQYGPNYELTYEDVTEELETALWIGLESYGSSKASWIIPSILKGGGNPNMKVFDVLVLYVQEVCGDYHIMEIADFWIGLDQEQRDVITAHIDKHLDDMAEYFINDFS